MPGCEQTRANNIDLLARGSAPMLRDARNAPDRRERAGVLLGEAGRVATLCFEAAVIPISNELFARTCTEVKRDPKCMGSMGRVWLHEVLTYGALRRYLVHLS